MNPQHTQPTYYALAMTIVFILIVAAGCEPVQPQDEDSCVTCHTNQETLKEVADEIQAVESSGEG